jgi:hypothetical protein
MPHLRSCVAVSILMTLAVGGLAQGAALHQTNPIRKAPDVINTPDPDIWDTYPWFSNDGKLFLFTREDTTAPNGVPEVYVSYLKNRNAIAGTPTDERTLPALEVAVPVKLPAAINNGETVKAIAYCEDDPPQPDALASRWRYRFALFFSRGDVQGERKMYRAWRVKVFVDFASQEINQVDIGGQVQLMGSGINVAGKNTTEPMLTRDGRYLFWASNAFAGTEARFIEVASPCTMLNEASQNYGNLPGNRFAWVDQYTVGALADLTSRTNYHTVVERPDGKTALIFERCHAQQEVECLEDPSSRYCDCEPNYGSLQTTGFTAVGEPHPIQPCCAATGKELNRPTVRYTHPAISGPRNADGSWLLFFMRGKKIWYTKIAE